MNLINNLQTSQETPLKALGSESNTTINETLSTGFSELLSLVENNLTGQGDNSNAGSDDSADMVTSMQQSLLSGLGLADFANIDMESLTSATGLSTMQNALFGQLQNDFFSSQTKQKMSLSDDVINEGLTDANSILSWVSNASQYSFGEDGVSMNDLYDSINILNHVPIVADYYQQSTSTDVSPISDIVGGLAYGGFLGLGIAAVNLAVESSTGKSIYLNLSDYFTGQFNQTAINDDSLTVTNTLQKAESAHKFASRIF